MRKGLALFTAAMMVFSLAACGQNKETTSGEKPAATETEAAESETTEPAEEAKTEDTDNGDQTTFTVGFDAEFPPYGYMDENGEYVGFDLGL